MKRKHQSTWRYIIALIIGTILFLSAFGLSSLFSYLEFQRVSNLQSDIAYNIFEHKLDYSLFDAGMCENKSFDKISQDLNFQGRIIDDLEKKLGKLNPNVLLRKKFYTLIELEHLEFIRNMNEICNSNIRTILFFYSNFEEDLDESEEVGRLLDAVYGRNDNLMVYSFDINLNSELMTKLKTKYGVEKSPTLIINEKFSVTDINNLEDIEKYLN